MTDLLAGFKGHPHVRHAIIFIDEVDKLSAHGADWRQAYCQGTQHALLKLVEGMEVTVDIRRLYEKRGGIKEVSPCYFSYDIIRLSFTYEKKPLSANGIFWL